MNKYLQQVQKESTKEWINTHLKAYLKKNKEDVSEIEHILDYLESDSAPKKLKKASYAQMQSNAEKWMKAQQKKGRDIDETSSDIHTVLDLGDGFKLVKLVGENAYKREGHLMSHCVASYHGRETDVYSLRDSSNKPHCTIEVTRNDAINQIKGKGNGSIHPKYIKYVVEILKYFNMDVRSQEMENLGYVLIPDGYKKLMSQVYNIPKKDIPVFKYKGSKYLYKYFEIESKVNIV